jgi:hypothetical protein
VIGGRKGAAARLGLNRSTLINKMKRLGVYRPEQDEALQANGTDRDRPESLR